jgi:hypothetical protein
MGIGIVCQLFIVVGKLFISACLSDPMNGLGVVVFSMVLLVGYL